MKQKRQKQFRMVVMAVFAVAAALFGAHTAFGVSIPSASSIAGQLESRYHMNLGSIQNMAADFNVAGDKNPAPEVSLFFSPSDPKPGEKVTAQAFPIYFNNPDTELYYTWYIKHKECGLKDGGLTADERAKCDLDGNGKITVNDWKIEAARIIADGTFDKNDANYSNDTDNDGYRARFGGDHQVSTPDHCFVYDSQDGQFYQLFDKTATFGCGSGKVAVCLSQTTTVDPSVMNCATSSSSTSNSWSSSSSSFSPDGTSSGTTGGGNTVNGNNSAACSGKTFQEGVVDEWNIVGSPLCVSGNVLSQQSMASCVHGQVACVPIDDSGPFSSSQLASGMTCSSIDEGSSRCDHLFPNAPENKSGDGTFGADEERFWGTNPNDPDTASNGNKDEANVVGLGQKTITWNYFPGDQVGLAVEGTAIPLTKYDDGSSMTSWAFSKKSCLVTGRGAFSPTIKGYAVNIPITDMDLNSCLAKNLIDPTEGGQASTIDLSVSSSPENPVNDVTGSDSGDTVTAQATVNNAAKQLSDTYFDWKVEISPDGTYNPANGWTNITAAQELKDNELLGRVQGNGIDSVSLKLDIKKLKGRDIGTFLDPATGVGYLRFSTKAYENFSSDGAMRKGGSDVIVKFTSVNSKINAYTVSTSDTAAGTRVDLNTSIEVCPGNSTSTDPATRALENLEARVCRVTKNEIIGLKLAADGLSNYSWTINGQPLTCSSKVSPSCPDAAQGAVNFFPVIGNVGDTFTISVTANNVAAAGSTEKTVTLSRAFQIVDPVVSIVSSDGSMWQKYLGQYKDASGKTYDDLSQSVWQGFTGSDIHLNPVFLPGHIGKQSEYSWTVDGQPITADNNGAIVFTAAKASGSVYNIALTAALLQPGNIRKALGDIWGASVLDTGETVFSSNVQMEVSEPVNIATGKKPTTFLATLSYYAPATLLFAVKVVLSIFLILFTASFLLSLMPAPEGSERKG